MFLIGWIPTTYQQVTESRRQGKHLYITHMNTCITHLCKYMFTTL